MITELLNKAQTNYPLSKHTTLKIGGNAELAFFPETVDELIEIRKHLLSNNKKVTVVGAGSNLLVSSKGVSGGVIFTLNMKKITGIDETRVKVNSGVKSVQFSKFAQENCLSGVEFLVGIPGTVGGAVTMNSSAHGQGIENTIESAEVLDIQTGKLITLNKSQLNLGYRYSFVESNRHLILNAIFNLKAGCINEINDKMNFHVEYRKQNHPPFTEPNAGSTFRNPAQGVYAGQLFEQLGAKSWIEGGAKVSDKHANFLINTGNATSEDVSRLMRKMHSSVKEKFGYDLMAEIRFVGDATEEEEAIWKSFQVH